MFHSKPPIRGFLNSWLGLPNTQVTHINLTFPWCLELFNCPVKVPVFLDPVIFYSGLAGANDNYKCLVCLSSGWVKLKWGVGISFAQRACLVVWVVSSCGGRSGSNGLKVKSSLVTQCFLLRGPRLKLNVLFICRANKCAPTELVNVLIYTETKKEHRVGVMVVLQKVWVLCFYMLPVVMSGLPQQELANLFHGKFTSEYTFLCHQCLAKTQQVGQQR